MSAGNLKKLAFSVFLLSVASALLAVQAAAQGAGFNSRCWRYKPQPRESALTLTASARPFTGCLRA